MSWVGVAIGGSALISGAASQSAASQQANAANKGTNTQLKMFNTVNQQQAPYRQAGYGALNELQTLLGIAQKPTEVLAPNRKDFFSGGTKAGPLAGVPATGADVMGGTIQKAHLPDPLHLYTQSSGPTFDRQGYHAAQDKYNQYQKDLATYNSDITNPEYGSLMHQFNANDLQTNLAPNYDFMLGQGQGATNALSNRAGGLISGNALKGINDYTQNYASNAYQNAFQNFTANQTNIFNRLSSIAGLGQTANQATAGAAASFAPNIANTQMAAGQAGAAGTVGTANAIGGGLNTLGSWYALNRPQSFDYGSLPSSNPVVNPTG